MKPRVLSCYGLNHRVVNMLRIHQAHNGKSLPRLASLRRLTLVLAAVLASVSSAAAARPTITVPPTNQVTMIFSNVTLSVVATGSHSLFYRWQKNGTNLA